MERQTGDEAGRTDKQLDFGWFKVPPTRDSVTTSSGGGEPNSIAAGRPAAPADIMQESLPISSPAPCGADTGQDPNSQERPPSNVCQRPPTHAGHRPPSNASRPPSHQANVCSADEAEKAFNRINESGCYEARSSMNKTYDENIIIDWPMSHVGEEQTKRFKNQADGMVQQHHIDQRPTTSCRRLETPPPPLNFQGYGPDRPTYASWREKWHKEQQRFYDTNNNRDDERCLYGELNDTDAVTGVNEYIDFRGADLESGMAELMEDGNTTRKRRCFTHNTHGYIREIKTVPEEPTLPSLPNDEDNYGKNRSLLQVITDKLKIITRWSRSQGIKDNKMTYYRYDKLDLGRQN